MICKIIVDNSTYHNPALRKTSQVRADRRRSWRSMMTYPGCITGVSPYPEWQASRSYHALIPNAGFKVAYKTQPRRPLQLRSALDCEALLSIRDSISVSVIITATGSHLYNRARDKVSCRIPQNGMIFRAPRCRCTTVR